MNFVKKIYQTIFFLVHMSMTYKLYAQNVALLNKTLKLDKKIKIKS
jgi:hypothetical protein